MYGYLCGSVSANAVEFFYVFGIFQKPFGKPFKAVKRLMMKLPSFWVSPKV